MNGVNYYQLFSLPPTASSDELKAQYRKLSLSCHPDRGGSTEQMAVLNEAYRVLSNPLLRREYDQKYVVSFTSNEDNYFWRWFAVLAVLGTALVAYDVMMTWIMPRYVVESSASASSESLTPSGDLTDEAASALSEFQASQPVVP